VSRQKTAINCHGLQAVVILVLMLMALAQYFFNDWQKKFYFFWEMKIFP
jgi:hypothetical protein